MVSLTKYAEAIKKMSNYFPWIYKIGSQFYYDKNYPRHIFVETTSSCNLSCDFCPREDVKNHMDWELFKEIVEEASFYGPRSFSLHLFGEPLLYPRIIDAIRYIKQCDRGHTILLTTNGTHLNHYFGELIERNLGVDEIIWTWRKEAKFKEETLRALCESTLHGHTKFRVRLIKELTPKEEFKRWSLWPKIEIRSLHNYGGGIDLSKWNVPNVTTRWPCYHLWFAPAVAWNGNILLCCADPKQKEVIGKFPDMSIAEGWQAIEKVRKSHLQGQYKGICEKCDVWKSYPNLFFGWQHAKSS